VAGVAAGSSYGVAKKATVLDVQMACASAGAAAATELAASLNGIVRDGQPGGVVNIATGADGTNADLVEKAVREVVSEGFTVVAAAGNFPAGQDACRLVPQRLPEVITVASTNDIDHRAWDSNFGSCVDIFAPGDQVTSASNAGDGEDATASGTSLAAPHVAGAAALVLAAHPTYSPDQVAGAIVGLAELDKINNTLGSPNRFLRVAEPLPDAPADLTATAATDGTIALSWQPVSAADVEYLVSQRDVTAGQAWFRWTNPVRAATTATATDLQPGHVYEFTVAAANTMAVSPESNVASATAVMLPPGPPTNLTATAKGGGTIELTWTAPEPDAWYWVYQRDVTLDEEEPTRLPLPITACCTMEAGYLEHGHEYEYTVSAINRAGEGPHSAPARAVATFDPPAPPGNLRVTPGDGEATLTWEESPGEVWYLVYQRNASENQQWQQLPLPITSCCTMTAGYLVNGDDYEFKVTATGFGVESAASNVVGVRPLPPLPPAPVNLRATPKDTGEIALTWDPVPLDVYYWVYWREANSGKPFIKATYPTDKTEATIGLLDNNQLYEFKVTADNLAGEGPGSIPVQARSQVALPKAPTDLIAVATENLQVHLTWEAPGPNMFYWVYWRDVTAGQSSFTKSTFPTDKTNAVIGPLTHDHVYEFKVTAQNLAGEGPASAIVEARAAGTVPAPPSELSATPGDGSVRLVWKPSPTPNVGYFVYYRDATTGQSWRRMPYPVMDCCTYTVSLLTNGHTYEFKVTAGNAAGESRATNVDSARPLPPFPQPPSNLRATAGDGKVTLAWNASPTPSVYYWIEYRVAGGTWKRLKYPVSTCCTFVVSYLANGTTYEFRIRATNVAGDSSPSNVDSARPLPPFPQPPTNLRATAGDGKVTLAWNASPTSNVWYIVDYRKAGGTWKRMPYPDTTCCSLTVSYLLNGKTYEFRVRATNLAGVSGATNTASARPMPPMPQRPTNLRATTAPGTGQVKLTWSASPTPRVYYYVYQRDYTLNGFWRRLPYPVSGTSMTAGYLAPGHTYQFKVTAINLTGESGPSNIASAMARYADGTTRYAEVTSSWIFNDLGGFDPVQRYDITGFVRGTRDGNYIRLNGGWALNNGKQLLEGIFWYNIVDCTEGYSVMHRTLGHETPTTAGAGLINFSYRMNPRNTYKVTVHGGGSITYSGAIYGRFHLYPARGIIPFVAETSCF
jgi:fibronectin type 3 domain-containing protein